MERLSHFGNFALLLLASGVFAGLLSQAAQAQEKTAQKIQVGVSTALTGNASTYGNDIRNALTFANERLARGRFDFVFEDDRCSGKDATTIAQKFAGVLHVKYVLGHACSGTVLASAPIYERAKILVISPSASSSEVSNAGEYIYRTWLSDAAAVQMLYEFMKSRHSTLGILSEQTDYAQSFAKGFRDRAKRDSKRLIEENYLSDHTDFRSLLLRLKGQGADSLFINSQTELTFLAVLKQLREMHWDVPLYGAYWPGAEAFLKPAGSLAEGIIFVDSPSAEQVLTEEGKQWYKEFTARYGPPQSIGILVATAIESVRALSQAIDSGEDERTYLNKTAFHGIFGDWHFDAFGDLAGIGFVMKQIRQGKPETLP